MPLGLLLGCQADPTTAQLRGSTISVSRSNATIPTGHYEDWIELRPDGSARDLHVDGYPVGDGVPVPRAFTASTVCRDGLVAAIVAARLGHIAQGSSRVGGGSTVVVVSGPGLAFTVSRAAAPEASWPAIETIAHAAFACARS